MKHDRKLEIVRRILQLPHKMVGVHGRENVPEFILHEIAAEACFDLPKAAYFVDNPDFNVFKGVCGIHKDETYRVQSIWEAQDHFSDHMKQSAFNNKVRMIENTSHKKACVCDEDIIEDIALALDMKNPWYHAWPLRHDNHGLLLFEASDEVMEHIEDDLHSACHLLSLCPVY